LPKGIVTPTHFFGKVNGSLLPKSGSVSGAMFGAAIKPQVDKSKLAAIIIQRFAKIEGSKQQQVIQTITFSQASVLQLNQSKPMPKP
jgi:hypothetical protein